MRNNNVLNFAQDGTTFFFIFLLFVRAYSTASRLVGEDRQPVTLFWFIDVEAIGPISPLQNIGYALVVMMGIVLAILSLRRYRTRLPLLAGLLAVILPAMATVGALIMTGIWRAPPELNLAIAAPFLLAGLYFLVAAAFERLHGIAADCRVRLQTMVFPFSLIAIMVAVLGELGPLADLHSRDAQEVGTFVLWIGFLVFLAASILYVVALKRSPNS